MAQANPFDQFDGQVQPVPVQSLRPIIGAVSPEEQERKARADALAEAAAARAQATFEGRGAPPQGYRYTADGNLEPIPGGPAASKIGGTAVPVGAANDAKANVGQFTALTRSLNTFKDDFGGNALGGLENTTEAFLGVGTEGQSEWWADFRTTDNLIRNTLFGASLTEGEKAAYNATTVTPGMRPEKIKANLTRRQEIIRGALQREREFFIANGYKPEAVDVLFRPVMQEGPTEEAAVNAPAAPVTEEESAAAFGEALFDANGNPVGPDYDGDYYDRDGKFLSAQVPVSDDEPFRNFDPRDEMGFLEGIGETLTGNARSTPEVEALPDWATMPELNSFSFASAAAGLGTMMTDPQETLAVIKQQFPGVQARQDANGNIIMRSSIDGKEYAIKPGFRVSDIPRAAGALAAFTPAGRATTATGAFAGGAATQAAIEATQAAAGGEFNPDQVAIAGGGGVVGQQAGRLINAARGARPARAPSARSTVLPDAPEVIAAGEANNVPVMTSDVRPARTWFGNWLQSTGEKLPIVGTGGKRAAQQESRVAMIEKLADDYSATPATIDDVTTDFMETRGKDIAKYTQQKREVFSSVAGAPPPVTQNSLDVLDKAIGRYGEQGTFAGLAAKLKTWRADLAGSRSIDDVEALRKSIGDTFDDESLKSASSAMRDIVNGHDGLYAAIKKDMGGYIRENAGEQGFNKWSASNAKLADFADDLEKSTLARVLRNGEATPEEAASLLFSKKPSDVAALFKNLSPEGQKRARALVVQKLVDDAGGIAELSTAKFRTALSKAKDTLGVTFPKDEADRLSGMLRLLQATRRAEQASVTTPTGQSALPFVGASGAGYLADGLFGAGAVSGATAASFRIYESKAMRNLLIALSKTQPGSRAESNVMGNITKTLATRASAPASNVVNFPQQSGMRVGASPTPLAAEDQNTRGDRTTTGEGPR